MKGISQILIFLTKLKKKLELHKLDYTGENFGKYHIGDPKL